MSNRSVLLFLPRTWHGSIRSCRPEWLPATGTIQSEWTVSAAERPTNQEFIPQLVLPPRSSRESNPLRQELSGTTGSKEENMFVITGASGKTGGAAAEKLLSHGEKVRVIGRDATRLERFTQNIAEAFVADVTDAGALKKAFSGAKAVYAMNPPNISAPDVRAYQERVNDALAAAIKINAVAHVVALSSVGADKSDKVGPVVGLHNMEKKLEAIAGLNAVFLRAGYFMENMLLQVGVIQSLGTVAAPIPPDLPLAMLATLDISAATSALP